MTDLMKITYLGFFASEVFKRCNVPPTIISSKFFISEYFNHAFKYDTLVTSQYASLCSILEDNYLIA